MRQTAPTATMESPLIARASTFLVWKTKGLTPKGQARAAETGTASADENLAGRMSPSAQTSGIGL